MKTLFSKLAAGLLLGFLAISPVSAQNNGPVEAGTNQSATNSEKFAKSKLEADKDLEKTRMDIEKDIEKTRMDNEKDLEKTRLDNEKQMANSRSDNHRSMVHDLAWNSWVILVIAFFFFGYLKDQRRQETIRLMVEKGTPLTPELLDSLRKKRQRAAYDPQGYLCWGVTMTFVAIALMIAFPYGAGRTAGWIVLAVGAANLILWLIERAYSNGGQSK
jgi:Domain of unknown function (DUF6249)